MKLPERMLWIVLLLALLLMSTYMISSYRGEMELYKIQVNAVQSENVQFRNKQNELVSEKQAFIGEKKDLKGQIEVWKKNGDTLRTKLTGATKDIFFLKRLIEINGKGNVITFKRDTQFLVGPTIIDTPVIAVDTADKFHSFRFAGNMKKYAYQVRVFDKSEMIAEDLGKKGTQVRLVNHNPYVIKSEVNSLIVPPKKVSVWKKIFWIGIGAGIGSSLVRF